MKFSRVFIMLAVVVALLVISMPAAMASHPVDDGTSSGRFSPIRSCLQVLRECYDKDPGPDVIGQCRCNTLPVIIQPPADLN